MKLIDVLVYRMQKYGKNARCKTFHLICWIIWPYCAQIYASFLSARCHLPLVLCKNLLSHCFCGHAACNVGKKALSSPRK